MEKRRKTKIEEIKESCQCCKFPISQRHHMMEFAKYGESENTTLLVCATCHWMIHICLGAHINHSNHHNALWKHLVDNLGYNDSRLQWVLSKVHEAQELKFEYFKNTIELDFDVYDFDGQSFCGQ